MRELYKKLELDRDKLRYRLEEERLIDLDMNKVDVCREIIGQNRAMKAMELGLQVRKKGYNVFVTGVSGTGRTTAVKLLLEEACRQDPQPDLQDICYVNNFKMPDSPRALYFPAGMGRKFAKAIQYLIDSLTTVIPKIFSSQDYRERRNRIVKEFESRQTDLYKDFDTQIKEKGFVLVQIQTGPTVRPDLHPVIDGQPVSFADVEQLVEEGKIKPEDVERLKSDYEILRKKLIETSEASKKISEDLEDELDKLDNSQVVPIINDKIDTLKGIYEGDKVKEYFEDLNEVLIDVLEVFRGDGSDQPQEQTFARAREYFSQFTVNQLVDNGEQTGRPIIVEDLCTFSNLFGSVERVYSPSTGWSSDFTRIRSGSIISANGGYLVLHAIDLFQDPFIWPTLKRVLRTGHLTITNSDSVNRTGSGLKPEPLELDVTVILVGNNNVYNILLQADDDFKKIFKVKAEFDSVMDNDRCGLQDYTRFIKRVVEEEDLMLPNKTGLAAVAEYGAKLSGYKDRLTTRFAKIADIVREASWLTQKKGRSEIDREMVAEAIEMQRQRVNLVETKIQEMYERDIYLMDVTGEKTGQINGLSVYDLGEYSFGRPTRITATVSPGADGVINIEREAELSGRLHSKGVLILSGFMRQRFGKKRPLVFTASLCFEQSYGGVDGDSASSTEIYVLLSALAGVPIKQGLAVTGSVNQNGEVQPIGGVNEKIEGFFDVCKINGLTGEQGVLIPKQNVPELMLRDEVVEAVEQGKFHIYEVGHIDEGLELLTGIPAGEADSNGNFPEGSVNYRADQRLSELAAIWKDYINK